MRIVLAKPGPAYSVEDVASGWARAFRALGVQLYEFASGERLDFFSHAHLKHRGRWRLAFDEETAGRLMLEGLEAVCYRVWPDVVFIVSGFYIPPVIMDLVRSRRMRVVLLCTESPYEDDTQLERASHADVVLLNDPTNLDAFAAVSKARYQPHCYDPSVHHPGDPRRDWACDVAFVGTGYPSRISLIERVNWRGLGLDLVLAGNWPVSIPAARHLDGCVSNADTADLYRSARAGFNVYRREAERDGLEYGWAMGPREVELAACQTFYVTEPRGENREVFPFVPTFDGPGDLGAKLRWYLAHDRVRERIAARAAERIAGRTFENAARALLTQIT